MGRDFDIFEQFPDGSSLWRVCVSGQFYALRTLQELAEHSENEFYAIDITYPESLPIRLAPRKSAMQIKSTAKRIA